MISARGMTLVLTSVIMGCSLESAVDVDDPTIGREVNHEHVTTRNGAVGLYYTAISRLQVAVSYNSMDVGIFTDELTNSTATASRLWLLGDARKESYRKNLTKGLEANGATYLLLHEARVHANQARSVLRALDDSSLAPLIANTYAIEGYSILMLAENFCSGVPLTHVPFDGDVVYGDALSTEQLFTVAVAKFDSALAVPQDSAAILTLARIGLGRAYLGLGKYQQASNAVSAVVATDVFYLDYTQNADPTGLQNNYAFWTAPVVSGQSKAQQVAIVNEEGLNGMTWFRDPEDLDPRVPVTTTMVNNVRTFPTEVQQRKFLNGTVRFPLARWVEAQMIRAEAALQQGDPSWITPVNEARTTVGLPALADPVVTDDRVDLLFAERAFWFYLEGVRLADFRRLVRQYQRNPSTVYPTGAYTRSNGEVSFYGEAWVFLTPLSEDEQNYRYNGCLHTNP